MEAKKKCGQFVHTCQEIEVEEIFIHLSGNLEGAKLRRLAHQSVGHPDEKAEIF